MTRLKNGNNIEADGIRDTFLNPNGNGSTSSLALNSTKIWERQPYRNGSAHSSSKATTSTNKFSDFGGCLKFAAGVTSFQTGSTKGAATNTVVGWGTAGGVQAATNGGSSTQIGTLYDGTTSYTTSPKPFDQLDGSFDGNKWVSFMGHISFGGLFPSPASKAIIVFEGSGAQTGDTDWTTVYRADDLESTNGNSVYDQFLSSVNVQTVTRSGASRVVTQFSRVVYEYDNAFFGLSNAGGQDFRSYVRFE